MASLTAIAVSVCLCINEKERETSEGAALFTLQQACSILIKILCILNIYFPFVERRGEERKGGQTQSCKIPSNLSFSLVFIYLRGDKR